MFCPRCAAQNVENASFCRACGANISLVPQALTGQLAVSLTVADDGAMEGGTRRRRRRKKKEQEPATMERAVRSLFMGVAFICVSLSVVFWMPGGSVWGFWMLLPAFGCLADGVASLLRMRAEQQKLAPPPFRPASTISPAGHTNELPPPRDLSAVYMPPGPTSVTEGTTRHLGAPVERPSNDV